MAQAAKIQVLVPEVPPAVVPAASTPIKEKRKAESKSKVTNSEPSLVRKSEKKKKKKREPSTKPEEEEESTTTTGTSKGGTELEDEEVLAIFPAEKRRSMNTWSSRKKEPPIDYKTPLAPKHQAKTSPKRESSQKRPKGK